LVAIILVCKRDDWNGLVIFCTLGTAPGFYRTTDNMVIFIIA